MKRKAQTGDPNAAIRRPDAMVPSGAFIVSYDEDSDLLWVGLASFDHSRGDIVEVEPDTLVTLSNQGTPQALVSSIAFTRASRHPLWHRLFGALDHSARQQSGIALSLWCNWFEGAR